MNPRDYIASERFIHDDLLQRAGRVVQRLPMWWRRDGCIHPVLLCWPGEPVKGDDGTVIDDPCVLDLSTTAAAARPAAIREMTQRTKAYGLFFVEQLETAVLAVFETKHGSQIWERAIRRHGDFLMLEEPVVTTDGPGLGVLWRARG